MKSFLIITGLSGAGKTIVSNHLEDLGYLCMDNIPPQLLPQLKGVLESGMERDKVALIVNVTENHNEILNKSISEFLKSKLNPKLIFLEATDECLITRYKASRRKHPLSSGDGPLGAVKRERELLEELKTLSNYVIDTTDKSPKELTALVDKTFEEKDFDRFIVNIVSYGYKYGLPIDVDLAFDVRFLINPYYIHELREKSGLDDEVYSYVLADEKTEEYIKRLIDFVDYSLIEFKNEGRGEVVIGIGCTGGKHRSVTLARYLNDYLSKKYNTTCSHRDVER